MENELFNQFLNLQEALLRAQLNALRQIRREMGIESEEVPKTDKVMSQVQMMYLILKEANQPMHIDQLIESAQKKFQVQLEKESVVSALSKRIRRNDRFIKTAPNTFFRISETGDE